MTNSPQHIVKSFDEQLHGLGEVVIRMGGMAKSQLDAAIQALMKRDSDSAARVVQQDAAIDALEERLNQDAVRLLALRQPMADDLREVLAALKISSDLERIGDYAKNVAKRVIAISQTAPIEPVTAIPRMGRLVQSIIKDTLDAYIVHDADLAVDVWRRDEEVDEMYTGLFREILTYMMEDPRNITAGTHLIFIAKNIERMGDHATNIAETIYFLVTGRQMEGGRPKGDASSFAVVEPPEERQEQNTTRTMTPRILIVEDEAALVTLLRYNFEREGFEVSEAMDGEEALLRAQEDKPDLIVLDWMLPLMSGIEVCRRLRRMPELRGVPVVMLTARGEEADKVRGLEGGADDYVTKPFSPVELIARIRALLRRAQPDLASETLVFADLSMELTAHKVRRDGRPVHLGPTEFRLLHFLLRHPGRVFSREQLLDAVWGRDVYVEARTVDVHIRRLRKALNGEGEVDLIRTVRSAGYALDQPGAA